MAYCKILFLYILISNILSINCELKMETVIGGTRAFPENYKFQIGIIGKHNNTNGNSMVCSAGILSNFFILGNAECFFDKIDELMKLRFYAIFKSVNLREDFYNAKEIIYIYTYTATPITDRHLLVVLKLMVSLNLENDNLLRKLQLPEKDAKFTMQPCIAGYGLKSMEEKRYHSGKSRVRVTKTRDFLLTYAYVDIVEGDDCQHSYSYMHPVKEFCGVIPALHPLQCRGLCSYDAGGPLIIGADLVIAVANRNRPDCNNTVHGNLYTKVSYYLDFINGVLFNNHTKETVIHRNRRHILNLDNYKE